MDPLSSFLFALFCVGIFVLIVVLIHDAWVAWQHGKEVNKLGDLLSYTGPDQKERFWKQAKVCDQIAERYWI